VMDAELDRRGGKGILIQRRQRAQSTRRQG
jgi:hypothetical protein